MIETRNRERLINALIYFSQETLYAGKTKLFKLLYSMDFEHYRETGRSVTGLNYKAWDQGPVPDDLFREMKMPEKDFNLALRKRIKKYQNGYEGEEYEPQVDFDEIYFSPFQLDLLEKLSKKYFRATAAQMSKESHEAFGCWDKVYNIDKNASGDIPYGLILDRQNNDRDKEIRELSKEYEDMVYNYG